MESSPGFAGPEASLMQSASPGKKSVGLAALYSLLLPGMGELYADGFSSGKYFLIADGMLWLTFAAFEASGNSLRDDSRAFAVSRAGVDPGGKDDQYYVDIGNFLDIHEYNEKQLRDREPELLYDPAAGYSWEWDSDASRATYREQRINSETMYNNQKFVVAGLIVNRVASAINAVRSVIAYNKALDEALGDLSFRADVMGGLSRPHGVLLTVTRSF
jgi:TM2 domain-containing membrane protein YozV